jgi:hypothetical protein
MVYPTHLNLNIINHKYHLAQDAQVIPPERLLEMQEVDHLACSHIIVSDIPFPVPYSPLPLGKAGPVQEGQVATPTPGFCPQITKSGICACTHPSIYACLT